MLQVSRRHLLAGGLGVLLLGGCQRAKPAPKLPPDFRYLGTLPGLTKSADPALQNELARLRAEEATPAQLAEREAAIDPLAIASLADEMPIERVDSLLDDIAKIYPEGRFVFSTAETMRAGDLLKNERDLFASAAGKFAAPDFRLAVDHCQGLLADLTLVDLAELAHRGKALEAQLALEKGELNAAQPCATWMLELDHALATARHVVPRLTGAQLRLEALRIVEAIVQYAGASYETLVHFRDLLHEHVAHWPPDADAWIGDRSQGLHTYEMIRHGLVLSVFNDKELDELSEEAGARATAKAIALDVDEDQRYYLDTMREVISASERPYHERRELLQKIARHLQEMRGSPDFPLVAGRILLVGLDAGHRRQAKDRAACEGWLIALALATGETPPDFKRNPETGTPYAIEREGTRVVVRNARAGEPDEAIVVPVLQ